MFKNHIKIALRNLWKQKIYAFINVLGLAVGMAACLLIYLFIDNELGFDRFHKKGESIYRLNEVQSFEGISPQHVALSMYPMGPALKAQYPEIAAFTRFVNAGNVLQYETKQIIVEKTFFTEPAFFSMFDFELRHGDRATALNEPNSAVLTVETAQELFGTDQVVGKSLGERQRQFKITGVLENVPQTSHLQFDALFSVNTIENEQMLKNWGSNWLVTYLLLAPGTNPANLEQVFPKFLEKNMGEGRKFYELYLQPLYDVHLASLHVTHDYHNHQKFDGKYIFIIEMNNTSNEKYETLRQEFLSNAAILDVTASGQRLGNNIHQNSARTRGDSAEIRLSPSHLHVARNFIQFYGLEIVAGRAFSEKIPTDKRFAYIVNEALVQDLGWKQPLGKEFGVSWEDTLGTVIGVVKDFNFNSLHHKIQPLYMSSQNWGYDEMSVKISPQNYAAALRHLESKWNELVPDRPFQCIFLDEHFAALYLSDKQVSQIVGLIAGLAIFTACLGLFGLASITTEQRTKEVGIRKVLGASVSGLIVLLAQNFARLVLIAFILAAPVAYFVMKSWLENFVYRVELGWWVFALAGGSALFIALLTVSTQAIKAALTNPVEALRYE